MVSATFAPFEYDDISQREVMYGVTIICTLIGFLAFNYGVYLFCSSEEWCPAWIHQVFVKLSTREKADWCSRAGSSLHAFIIIPGFCATLAGTKWSDDVSSPLDEQAVKIRYIMCVSVAYFIQDLGMIIIWRVPLYGVFIAHHIVAVIPFLNHLFNRLCVRGTFELGLFLLVEFATLFVNGQAYAEVLGYAESKFHISMIYGTYISWIATRVVLPLWIMVHLYTTVMTNTIVQNAAPGVGCMVFPFILAHMITLFCLAVFAFVLTPALYHRWYPSEEKKAEDAKNKKEQEDEEEKDRKSREEPIAKGSGTPITGHLEGAEVPLKKEKRKGGQGVEHDDHEDEEGHELQQRPSATSAASAASGGDTTAVLVKQDHDDDEKEGTTRTQHHKHPQQQHEEENVKRMHHTFEDKPSAGTDTLTEGQLSALGHM